MADDRVWCRVVVESVDGDGGRWMNSWVEDGMRDKRREGSGRGRTRWMISGAEGRVVAIYVSLALLVI